VVGPHQRLTTVALEIAAVVINYNASDHLAECIRSLYADGFTEVVVADNASSDDFAAVLLKIDPAPVVIHTGANLGFGAGANRGVEATSAPLVAVMNPDVVIESGTRKALVDAFERDPRLAIAGPRVDNRDGSLYPSARTFPSLLDAAGHAVFGFVAPANRFTRRYRMLDWDHAAGRDVDWVSGTFLVVRRDVFDRVGGFDEGYFMYVEDVDLCWRVGRDGGRVAYEPEARVTHAIGASSEQTPYRMILAHHRSLWRFSRRTTGGVRRALLPVVGLSLAGRVLLAWLQRAIRRRPHASL
jgi:N-acetylglucosaminyl-diphospho-decaprenol L-rhamnosyltransferase